MTLIMQLLNHQFIRIDCMIHFVSNNNITGISLTKQYEKSLRGKCTRFVHTVKAQHTIPRSDRNDTKVFQRTTEFIHLRNSYSVAVVTYCTIDDECTTLYVGILYARVVCIHNERKNENRSPLHTQQKTFRVNGVVLSVGS